ncbi:MAG: hypothetical protein HC836_23045 [Richelia sp. RM2_1_2]|nr:hypothetical protein [Richelia sp. RM2_1_2]
MAERKFDTESGLYTKDLGNLYSVERSMPVPYDMGIKVDIWTTSEEQKLQIFEQLAVLFNPEVWFQSNVNPLDWTAITTIIQDGIEWSSRSVPVGTESSIDIMSWTFLVPIWINPPAKVRRQSVIHQIVTNIVEHECFGIGWDNRYGDSDLLAQIVTTPNNHQIRVDNEEVTLLSADGSEVNGFGNIFAWKPLLEKYGVFKPGSTRLYIKRYATDLDDYTHDVTGILDYHPTKENVLLFTLDPLSLPGNTLQPINAVIDPHVQYPGYGLPLPILGQRYLLTENTWTEEVGGEDKNSQSGYTEAWQQLTANANDIIEYTNSGWAVAFSAFASQDQQFVLNSYSGKQLTFDGKNWVLAVDGEYHPGFWRLGIAGFNPGTDEELCA